MEDKEALKKAWLDGFEYGVDVACDFASEAYKSRLEYWGESDTYKDITPEKVPEDGE